MLIAIDIGNSNVTLGFFENDLLTYRLRLITDLMASAQGYSRAMKQLLTDNTISLQPLEGVIVASVVPDLDATIEEACLHVFDKKPLMIPRDYSVEIAMKVDDKAQVGADLVVNAYAAWHLYKCPLIIVDSGTATTFQAINGQGELVGVAISPGLEIGANALFNRAAKLEKIALEKPGNVLGKNTADAIKSGVFFGHAELIDGMVRRIIADFANAKVLLTGGFATMLYSSCTTIDIIDNDLTLKGLNKIFKNNAFIQAFSHTQPGCMLSSREPKSSKNG